MSSPFKLFRLQQLDSQLDKLKLNLQEIEIKLKDDNELRLAIAAQSEAQRTWEETNKALSKSEEAVSQQRVKIEQNESSLYSGRIQNPKELKDLQDEVASLKRYLSVLEERQFESMLVEEEAAGTLRRAELSFQRVEADQRMTLSNLTQEKSRLLHDIERSETERKTVSGDIEPGDLSIYEQLRQKRKGIAIARVNEKACSACGSLLNSALLNAARSPTQINYCDVCGRILYTG